MLSVEDVLDETDAYKEYMSFLDILFDQYKDLTCPHFLKAGVLNSYYLTN